MDIDTTPPPKHCEGKPTMQLEIPTSDQVMMEVDPDFSLRAAPVPPSLDANHFSSPSSTPTFNLHSTSPSRTSPNSKPLDSASQALRLIPSPPVVLIASSDLSAWPKFKLDQLFVEWLSRPESKSWLSNLLDEARSGKVPAAVLQDSEVRVKVERSLSPGTRSPNSSQPNQALAAQQAPSSPVSRLFSKHIPFGDADSSPRSPTKAPSSSPYRHAPVPLLVGHLDLGKSGTASPFVSDEIVTDEGHAGSSRTSQQSPVAGSSQLEPKSEGEQAMKSETQQISDSKALDKVADGIAGMSAVQEHSRSPSEDTAEMTIERRASARPSTGDQRMAPETEVTLQASQPLGIVDRVKHEGQSSQKDDGRRTVSEPRHFSQSRESGAVRISGELDKIGELGKSPSPIRQEPREDATANVAAVASDHSVKVPKSFDSLLLDTVSQSAERVTPKLVSAAMPPTAPKPSSPEDATMLDATPRPSKKKGLPRFYFPCGREADTREKKEFETMKDFFKNLRSQKQVPGVSRTDIAELVVEVIGLPSYFASIVYNAIQELFGKSQLTGNGEKRQQNTPNTNFKTEESEGMMKDISDKDEGRASQVRVRHNSKSGEASQHAEQVTKLDTTMGDVHSSDGQDRHVNGFRVVSEGHRKTSPEVVQDPTVVTDGSNSLSAGNSHDFVTEKQFKAYYNAKCAGCSKEARLFNALLEPGATREYLIPNDFKPLLRALLMCHQGLAFLQATPEFQQRYSETVIERIYFGCTRQHNGRLTLQDIKRSKLLDTLMVVDEEEDINRERKYFSYEHFYVLYCRFWELDANHDLQIDREDLMRYGSHSLTYRIVDRIFGGYARPLDTPENPGYMSYTDFIWFCLSEEDKTSDTAIDYWFRCIDMDGDGLITMYDMEFFYKEQLHRMECFGHEPVQIRDILCQLLDMINPNVQPPVIRRRDLKRCRLAGNFFNVLFNLNKFFAIEARDPLQIRQEHATPELTDWDRFAALEYLRLSAEEEGEEDESWEDVGDSTNPLMAGEAPF